MIGLIILESVIKTNTINRIIWWVKELISVIIIKIKGLELLEDKASKINEVETNIQVVDIKHHFKIQWVLLIWGTIIMEEVITWTEASKTITITLAINQGTETKCNRTMVVNHQCKFHPLKIMEEWGQVEGSIHFQQEYQVSTINTMP